MVMTSDFYTLGIWRFRVRVPAGVLGNLFGSGIMTTLFCCMKPKLQLGGSENVRRRPIEVLGSDVF